MQGVIELLSNQAFLQFATLVVTTLGGAVLAFFQWRTKAQVKENGEKQAIKVEEVRTTLEQNTSTTTAKLDRAIKTGDDIHTLVNSDMGKVLKIAAVALRDLANDAPSPARIQAAQVAEQALTDHEKKQAIVDAGLTTSGAGGTLPAGQRSTVAAMQEVTKAAREVRTSVAADIQEVKADVKEVKSDVKDVKKATEE